MEKKQGGFLDKILDSDDIYPNPNSDEDALLAKNKQAGSIPFWSPTPYQNGCYKLMYFVIFLVLIYFGIIKISFPAFSK